MTEAEIIEIKQEWLRKRALILNHIYRCVDLPQSRDFSEYNEILMLSNKIEDVTPALAQQMRDDLIDITDVFKQWLKTVFPFPAN